MSSHSSPNGSKTVLLEDPSVSTPSPKPGQSNEEVQANDEEDLQMMKTRKLVRSNKTTNPLKFKVWQAGHFLTLGFGSIALLFQFFWLPNKYYINSICYRLTFIGGILAMLATFSKKFGLRYLPAPAAMLSQQNFQYLLLAAVWIVSFKSIFKIIPYYLLAILHVGNWKEISVIQENSEFISSLIAYDELLLIVYLFLRTILFRGGSGFQLVLFCIFYWLRILYNKETRRLFGAIVERLDFEMTKVKNEKVSHYWRKVKLNIQDKQEQNAI
ncbi:putative membrane protein [Spathaspora sp. JA1]|nr:putative membrane protein [Spathaspora sp. JA1]